jgi:hypothetical protein
VWKQETIPEEWRMGLLFKLPKKGNVLNCSNWRGIAFLPLINKIFSRITLEIIKNLIETKLRREQVGCRSKRSCVDQINTVRILTEQSNEFLSAI